MPTTPVIPKLSDPWLPDPVDGTIPLSFPCAPVVVCRYTKPLGSQGTLQTLDNVVCRTLGINLGAQPSRARFRYIFGTGDPDAPQTSEQALSTGVSLPKLVEENDQLIVYAKRPSDFRWIPLFWGTVVGFHVDLQGRTELVTFDAVSVTQKPWNKPVAGAAWRDADKAHTADATNVQTDLPVYFNPHGRPNCVPDDGWSRDANQGSAYPGFLDADNPDATFWDLAKAARYLIFKSLEDDPLDDILFPIPNGNNLDGLLVSQEPKDGIDFDPDNPFTYDHKPITVADKPADGKSWPMVVESLIADKGFAFAWNLNWDQDAGGPKPIPTYEMLLFRPQSNVFADGTPREPKDLWLQPRGQYLDLSYTNLGGISISRDLTEVVNEWDVEGDLEEKEIGIVLALGRPSKTAESVITTYDLASVNLPGSEYYNDFRLWIADESGEGHYLPGSDTLTKTVLNLDDIFGVPADPLTGLPLTPDPDTGEFDPSGVRQYSHRRRPTIDTLITKDERGQPYRAQLSFSTNYGGNGMQTLTPSAAITAGSFTLGVGAATTGSLSYTSTAAAIGTALAGLSTVGAGNVATSGGPINTAPVYIFARGALAGQVMPDIAVTPTGITGGTIGQSTQSAGGAKCPAVWDGSGAWTNIPGGFHVLKDRIGVRLIMNNPNHIQFGDKGVLKGIESLANPSDKNRPFWLRLTCVVRGDKRVRGRAERKLSSIVTTTIRRTVNAHDRYKSQIVCPSSEFNDTDYDDVIRDDTDAALAEATAMQLASQTGLLSGPVTVPRFTAYYRLGDRIRSIQGRNLGFRTDGDGTDREPTYPVVEGITWNLDGQQTTTLTLSDASAARMGYHSRFRAAKRRR